MRIAFTLLVALLVASPALAQRDLAFGFSVGGNLSSLVPDYDDIVDGGIDIGVERELGFGAAAFVEALITDNLAASAEASFARRGYSYPITFTSIDGPEERIEEQFTTSLNFTSLGVLGRVLPFGQHPYSPYLVAGPRLDVLLGSDAGRVLPPEDLEGAPPFYEDEFVPLFADVSLSGVVGLGVAVERPKWPGLRAEVRYGRTLTDFLVDAPVKGSVSGFDVSLGFVW